MVQGLKPSNQFGAKNSSQLKPTRDERTLSPLLVDLSFEPELEFKALDYSEGGLVA